MKPVSEWGLTSRERQAIEAVIQSGSNKGAAQALGVSVKTIDVYMTQALRKSEAGSFNAGRVHLLLAYDRYTRGVAGKEKRPVARDDLIALAREAGFIIDEASRAAQPQCINWPGQLVDEPLARFAELVGAFAPGRARATPEQINDARVYAADGENISIDDDALVSLPTEEGDPIWIQAWVRINV